MNYEDRKLFSGDETIFLEKKKLFIANSKITKEITTLHEKLKLAENDEERKKIASLILKKDEERERNWKQIDEF